MSQLKHVDEQYPIQATKKIPEPAGSAKKSSECSGSIDMAVTVRQIEQRRTPPPVNPTWKSYVDRLFEQGHSADEIQRLLREASDASPERDPPNLQEVFDYIKTTAKSKRAKTAPSGIEFISRSPKTISPFRELSQSSETNRRENTMVSPTSSPTLVKDDDHSSDTIRNRTCLSSIRDSFQTRSQPWTQSQINSVHPLFCPTVVRGNRPNQQDWLLNRRQQKQWIPTTNRKYQRHRSIHLVSKHLQRPQKNQLHFYRTTNLHK